MLGTLGLGSFAMSKTEFRDKERVELQWLPQGKLAIASKLTTLQDISQLITLRKQQRDTISRPNDQSAALSVGSTSPCSEPGAEKRPERCGERT